MEHFEDLLNPTDLPSVEEAELDDSGEASLISLAEVFEVVKKLLNGMSLGVDEICPEKLKALDMAIMAGTPVQCCMEIGDSACGLADQCAGSHSQKRGLEGVLQLSVNHTT